MNLLAEALLARCFSLLSSLFIALRGLLPSLDRVLSLSLVTPTPQYPDIYDLDL